MLDLLIFFVLSIVLTAPVAHIVHTVGVLDVLHLPLLVAEHLVVVGLDRLPAFLHSGGCSHSCDGHAVLTFAMFSRRAYSNWRNATAESGYYADGLSRAPCCRHHALLLIVCLASHRQYLLPHFDRLSIQPAFVAP